MLYEICDIQWISHEIHQSTRILLKTKEFHRISWNKQDLTHFYKIQHNFTKTIRIYGNPLISKDFMKSYRILLKATEFYRISIKFITDFTADFIADFTMNVIYGFHCRFHYRLHYIFHYGFHCKFHVKSTRFHYLCHGNFITSTRISPKSTRFHEVHNFLQDFT